MSLLFQATLLPALWAALAVSAAEPKRIYLANDDHTDYLWSADEPTYRAAFLEMLDFYLDLADATDPNPSDFQSRWNCDGHFWVWTYERHKTPAEFQRLIERIRSGHISVPLNPLAIVFGGAPAEAVIRSAYYPGHLERRFGLSFPLAYAIEDQTLPYGLGALWAGCGARYSWKGVCACASRLPDQGKAWRPHEIYYWAGPDGSRLLLKWNSLTANNQTLGGYAEAYDPARVVDYVDGDAEFARHYPYPVIGAFGKGWDDLKTLTAEFITVARQKSNTQRRVIVSNEIDFFEDFERSCPNVPSFNASFGNEWELYVASLAEVSARVKRAVEKLRGAEALATLVSLVRPEFMAGRETARDRAFMNLGLYFEHDWTADGKIISRAARAQWQKRIAAEIEDYVDTLEAEAASALGGLIRHDGKSRRFFAFNPLSWRRTDAADVPLPLLPSRPRPADPSSVRPGENAPKAGEGAGDPVHVVDLATGEEVPSQIVAAEGGRSLRVLARDVPPVGYKVFEVRPGRGKDFGPAAVVTGANTMENAFYRLGLAGSGAITSLVDRTRGDREFVRVVGGRAMNDLGAGNGSGNGSGRVQVEDAGPVSVTLLATATTPLAHRSRVTLFRESPRIAVRNEITQNFGTVETWSFGFNLNAPEVWHEEVGAVIRARLLDDGGHYSPVHARYDWLTLNHFADLSGEGVGVTLANADCYYFRFGASSTTRLDTATPQISVLAGGQVDGPGLGIVGQDGDSYFRQRFALQTHGTFNAPAAMRFALESQNPFVTGVVSEGAAYPEAEHALLDLSDPNVLLWALKPAEEGIRQGLIARLWNLSTNPVPFTLKLASPLARAMRTTHIETDQQAATLANGVLSARLNGQQLQTFRLWLAPAATR